MLWLEKIKDTSTSVHLSRWQIFCVFCFCFYFTLGERLSLAWKDPVECGDTASSWQTVFSVGYLCITYRAGCLDHFSRLMCIFYRCSFTSFLRSSGVFDIQSLAKKTHLMLSYLILPKGVILWKCENTLPNYINRCIVTETHFKYLREFILLTYI